MAVSTTRLDGNNIGFFLDGVLTADVFALDLATGAVTSAYLRPDDILAMQVGVESLFSFIPYASRNAAALQILSRLFALAPADAGTYTPSAVIVGDLATFRVTGAAPGGRFIGHVPFSMDGAIAWATGLGGGAAASPFQTKTYDITVPMILAAASATPTLPNVGWPTGMSTAKIFTVAAKILNAPFAENIFTPNSLYVAFYDPPAYYPQWSYMTQLYFSSFGTGFNPGAAASSLITPGLAGVWNAPYIGLFGYDTSMSGQIDFTQIANNGCVIRVEFTYF